jgi:hypothetical protein
MIRGDTMNVSIPASLEYQAKTPIFIENIFLRRKIL